MNNAHKVDSPTASFELVSHETRVSILNILADHQRRRPHEPHLPFSEVRERVDHHDPGNFNYHLNKLLGSLVTKHSDGYQLSYIGLKIVGAINANHYDCAEEGCFLEIATLCPICGEPAMASYEEDLLRFECDNDHEPQLNFPHKLTDRDKHNNLLRILSLINQQEMELALQNVCPLCYSQMASRIEFDDANEDTHTHMFRGTCDTCGLHICNTAGSCIIRHPVTVGFLYGHGEDIRTEPYWMFDFCTDEAVMISETPLRLRVDIERGEQELRLTLNENANVVDIKRTSTAKFSEK